MTLRRGACILASLPFVYVFGVGLVAVCGERWLRKHAV